MENKSKGLKTDIKIYLIFTALGIVNAIFYLILSHFNVIKASTVGYAALIEFLIVLWVPKLVSMVLKFKLNTSLLVAFEIFISMAILAGSGWRVYDLGIYFDKFVHTISGVLFALACYNFYEQSSGNKLNLFWVFILMFSFSMAVGGIWEIMEFTYDGIMGANAQKALGFIEREALYDTMFDIICDFVGAIIGATIITVSERKKRKIPPVLIEKQDNFDEKCKN